MGINVRSFCAAGILSMLLAIGSGRGGPPPMEASSQVVPRAVEILSFPKGRSRVSVPFTLADGVPMISDVRINGKFLGRFIIDTGARVSYINREAANRDALPVALRLHFTCKDHRIDIRHADRLQIGSILLTNDAISTHAFSHIKSSAYKLVVGGIGGDILGQLPFTIDYRKSELIFYNPKTFHAPKGATAYPLSIGFGTGRSQAGRRSAKLFATVGVPILTVKINGKPRLACPDTGTTVAAVLMPGFIRKHPELVDWQRFIQGIRDVELRGEVYGSRGVTISVLGKKIDAPDRIYAVTTKPWQLDQENFSRPALLVGYGFLKNYRLTFDYVAKKLWVQRRWPLPYKVQLADGLNPNGAGLTGETPLMRAASNRDLVGVEALLDAGANPLARNKSGRSVLDYASYGGSGRILKILLAGPAKRDINDASLPLAEAVSGQGGPAAWDELLKAGADVNPGPDPVATPLTAAVRCNNIKAVYWLIGHGASPNAADNSGTTPLSVAAWCGNLQIFQFLRAHGAKLVIKGRDPSAILFVAAQGGHASMVKFLLSRAGGAISVNARDRWGQTPLMIAAGYGEIKAARVLIKSGAGVNLVAPGKGNQTALFFAAAHEQPDMLRFLIRHGANVNARNLLGGTPLMVAAGNTNPRDVLALLKAGADVNARGSRGSTALEAGTASGCAKVVKLLLAHGAAANIADDTGFTPLMAAAAKNGVQAASALINAGSKVNARASGEDGADALDYAVQTGNVAVAGLLIRHGANVNAADSRGVTPLMTASATGSIPLLRALIRAGARVNFKATGAGAVGVDALDLAAQSKSLPIVKLLLLRHAKVDVTTSSGRTALLIAVHLGCSRVASALIGAGANVNMVAMGKDGTTPLICAAEAGDLPIVKLLLKHGAEVNLPDSSGLTPLIAAAGYGHPRVASALINAAANVNMVTTGSNGTDALAYAASAGGLNMVKLLINHGANVNVRNADGQTPIVSAVYYGEIKTTIALIHAGADVMRADKFGLTPLDYACEGKNPSVLVPVLLKAGADPRSEDKKGRDALYYAMKSKIPTVINLIKESLVKFTAKPRNSNAKKTPAP